MGVYLVTQEQYQKVMDVNPSGFTRQNGGGPDHPVDSVNWSDAVTFCAKLSALPGELRAGREYRLPTEAEWEYACRAGTTTPFHFGSSLSSREANFNGDEYPYGGAEKGPYLKKTTPVGSYKPNPWGLYDMHGNVWQWCADWADSNYYKRSPRQDPPGPASGNCRILRGGSWLDNGGNLRSASHVWNVPDGRYSNFGFRVVASPASRTP
jgi:formylglycine-generating enzyme required for sulfatase activity